LSLFRQSLHPRSIEHAATIILAGSFAIFKHARDQWQAEPERSMALALLEGDEAAFNEIAAQARAFA
jgi:hypothetical protein